MKQHSCVPEVQTGMQDDNCIALPLSCISLDFSLTRTIRTLDVSGHELEFRDDAFYSSIPIVKDDTSYILVLML